MNTPQMTEQEIGLFIRQNLNIGTARLGEATCERIFDARRVALAHHAKLQSQTTVFSVGHHVLAWSTEHLRPFALALCLMTALFTCNYLMSRQHVAELEEVDSALLADDLPIDAYLDKGFDTWLSNAPQQR